MKMTKVITSSLEIKYPLSNEGTKLIDKGTRKKFVSPRWLVKILVNQTQRENFYLTIPWRREMVSTSRINTFVMDISVDSRKQSLSPLIDLVRNGGFRRNTNSITPSPRGQALVRGVSTGRTGPTWKLIQFSCV